jgi:hypothetical protein
MSLERAEPVRFGGSSLFHAGAPEAALNPIDTGWWW